MSRIRRRPSTRACPGRPWRSHSRILYWASIRSADCFLNWEAPAGCGPQNRKERTMTSILLVDDKESNLLALRKVLRGVEAEIVTAMSGDEALRASLNHEFALAILDVQMPGMDGFELASLLRSDRRTRHVPIIFLSAVYFEDTHIFKGYSSGAVDFLAKPFHPEILLSKVRVFLELDAGKAEIVRQKESLEKLVKQLEEEMEARRKAEKELAKVRMLEALGTLAGGIAHDFNNMMMGVLGKINLARLNGKDWRTASNLLGEAEKAILGATELTNKFITFSGGGKPLRRRVVVGQFLGDSVVSALTGFEIRYEFSVHEGVWDIEVDLKKMNQVIFVLLTNAREAMPHEGVLGIRADNLEVDPGGETPVPGMKAGPYVAIIITDQGPGIAAENIDKIFDPYYSTKQRSNRKGMGLGLSIAHSIITRHGGYIQVQSDGTSGTSVHIYLPAVKQTQAG